MIEEEKTTMDRVANVWITFAVLGAIAGITSFLAGMLLLGIPSLPAGLLGWAIGLVTGITLAWFRWARILTGLILSSIWMLGNSS